MFDGGVCDTQNGLFHVHLDHMLFCGDPLEALMRYETDTMLSRLYVYRFFSIRLPVPYAIYRFILFATFL